jgi:hypothetical protein
MRRLAHIAAFGNMMFGIMVLGICVPSAQAQRGFAAPHFSFSGGIGNRGYGANPYSRPGSFFYPLAVPADAYYGDALLAGYPVASQPPVVILQAPPAAGAVAETHTGEPVLIELQGDSYVRVSGPPASGAMLDSQASRGESAPTHQTHSAQSSGVRQLAAVQPSAAQPKFVTLVFRDGHREDVSDYVIANGTLYAHTSYYTSGAWTKNINLAALDVPETVSYNESHGVRFQLPNAANEVIVGP